ncbi:hypothetical protein BT93_F1927 [Corymbia citriodora subsp. variegata]|nr:hypothetical protein BT93_F1927 [Corymbia citriodora subsp. variegata]
MSSDSDDLDEDELLQIALKEQAERDLSYKKPGPNPRKPVANYVQPPPMPHQQRAPAAAAPPPAARASYNGGAQRQVGSGGKSKGGSNGNRRVVDDDDDSEVEMLSISSGDEDSTKDRAGSRARGGVSGGARPGRDDDRAWDGEEPDCWKHVDEDELTRRVRDMRETRAAPVAQKLEKKASVVGVKGLNTLQSFPRGMECVDPLGLGIIDNKSLRLITETSESSPSKSSKDNVDNILREKLMYFSENFDAKIFLSRIHQDTRAADLEAGALALKTDLRGRTQQRKQLVKENFDCFVSCKTTIDDIESKLRRIEEDPEGTGTAHLFNTIQDVSSLASRAFEPLFERQAQAEKIRSVQGMLQRFRTLFNLPSTIRGSISKGEYDLAVREYKKAKSIALPSHVGILKRVLEEVEKVMQEFKGTLYKSMEDPHIDLGNLENTVRLLLELEPESDPVWHYLNIQNQRIRGLLERCSLEHEARREKLQNELRERAVSDARWRHIQQNLNEPSDDNINMLVDAESPDFAGEEVDALRGKYVHRLTSVIVYHVPAFWKVALSVFSGKFAKSSQVSADSNINSTGNKPEEKYSSHSLEEVAGMIRQTLSAYEAKVHNTFRELGESNILQPYMSDAINEISKACRSFEVKESAPQSAVSALRALHSEITKIYILRLCSWMRSMTEEASKEETWVPVSILERNKSPYTISFLPLAFRAIVSSAMDQINMMIQSVKSEATKSEDMLVQLQEILESIRLAFLNCFLDFAGHLEHIGVELSQNKSGKESPYMQNGYSNELEENISTDLPGSAHQRLLIVLSNIGYCKDELSYELYNKYRQIWLQSTVKDEGDSDIQDLVISFSGLEEKILEQYTFAKANLIREAAVSYLLDSGVHWGSAPAVKGVRDAAVELMHTLVAVHAEVYAGAKPLLEKILGVLVEGLVDTFLSLFNENKGKELRSLDANGFCQLMLELEYFEFVLNPYFTADARESLKSLQGVLLEKATESMSEAAENPGHHRRPTRGSEDALADERQQGMGVSPDDLIALAQQYSSELLQAELERTRINTACFVESIALDSVPEPARAAYTPSFRGSVNSPSRNYRGTAVVGSPSYSRQRRR